MDLDAIVGSLKSQVLGSLETHVYQQAVAQNLVDTVLRELVEGAVEKLQGDIAEMQRTWRPRNDAGPLPPMPWPPAGEDIEIEEYAEVA